MSQEQLESECLEAFKQGNKRDAERLLPQIRQPAKVMIRFRYEWSTITVKVNGIELDIHNQSSLLHLAAAHGWMDFVIDLITKYKCDPNCKNYRKRTPLHYASTAGQLETKVVRYFINEQHCDPMTKDRWDRTPLYCACQDGQLNIVQYLINEQHCDPMTKDRWDQTLLHYACEYGHLNIAQHLINEQHCDPMTKDLWVDRTPLHYACRHTLLKNNCHGDTPRVVSGPV